MNKDNTFLAGGVKLYNYKVSDKLYTSIGFDVWKQPENLLFTDNLGELGGNAYLKVNYLAFKSTSSFVKKIGVFTNAFYKSNGFLPEYYYLENDFGVRLGLSFSY